MIDNKTIYNKLINVPFLDLGPLPNFDLLFNESLQIYNTTKLTEMQTLNPTDNLYLNLSVEGIFDYKGFPEISAHCDSCLKDYKVQGKLHLPYTVAEKTKATQFSKKVPAITDYITSILDHPGRARFSVLKAKSSVGWHTHFQSYELSELALHIVLRTNPKVTAEVSYCDFANLNSVDDWYHQPENKIYSTHFTQGNLWLLNTNHYHRFVNDSDEDRIHVWITTFLYDNHGNSVNHKLANKINQALDSYQGNYVSKC